MLIFNQNFTDHLRTIKISSNTFSLQLHLFLFNFKREKNEKTKTK